MTYDIFISYRRSDLPKAERLHGLLKQRGVNAWYDTFLAAGDDWRAGTAKALVEAPVFVLLFSKDASRSDEVVKELSAATLHKKTVIPVRLENLQPEGAFLYELASRNWFDAYENTEERLQVLADQLELLVKGRTSVQPPTVIRPQKRRAMAIGAIGLVAIAMAVAAYLAAGPGTADGDQPAKTARVAFFGFSASDDDPVSKNIAAIATDESFVNLAARHVDILARGETTGPLAQSRLARAGELGANFALSGEVRRDGELARLTMRLEDVTHKSTLWESTVHGATSTPVPTAFSGADIVLEVTDCVATAAYTGEAGLRNAAALPLVAAACGASATRGGHSRFIGLLREMRERKLGGPDLDAAFAFNAARGIDSASPAQRRTLMSEAEEAFAVAEQAEPESFATASARFAIATISNTAPLDWIPHLERSLVRAAGPRETFWHAVANRRAGGSLISAGRLRDGVGYLKAASDADPITNSNVTAYAVALAASGQIDTGQQMSWDARIEEVMRDRPDTWIWEFGVAAAIFSGRGDVTRLFALAPAALPEYVPTCYRDLHAALKLTGAAARFAAAKKAETCLTLFDSPHMIVQAASMLGDLDAAFARIDTRDEAWLLIRFYYAPWFMPSTRAMRADGRFLPIMEKLGYVDYWKETGTRPDVCATADEERIPLCVALAALPAVK